MMKISSETDVSVVCVFLPQVFEEVDAFLQGREPEGTFREDG